MEFLILNGEFAKALRKCSFALVKMTTIPILSNFKLSLSDGWLTLTATDVNLSIRCSIPAEIRKEGALCLPGQKLLSIVSALSPNDKLLLKVGDRRRVTISCGKSKFVLSGEDVQGFPDVPPTPDNQVEFESPKFLKAVKRTVFIVAKVKESRQASPVIYFESKDGECAMFATDNHRIGVMSWQQECPKFKDMIAVEAAQSFDSIFSEEGTVGFAWDENLLWFQQPNIALAARKTVGSGNLDYKRVVGKQLDHQLTLESESFKNSLNRSMICAYASKDGPASVDLNFTSADLTLFGSDDKAGNESSELVEIQYDGDPVEARFAGQYLTEGISAVDTPQMSLHFTNGNSQFEMRPSPADGYRYIVMPRRK